MKRIVYNEESLENTAIALFRMAPVWGGMESPLEMLKYMHDSAEEFLAEGGYIGVCGFYLYSHVYGSKVYIGAAVDPRVVLSHLTKTE